MSAVVETSVVARKRHWCEEYAAGHQIEPGETYARLVAFPDGDVNTGTTPWVLRLCEEHFIQYGRPMPPRARRRKTARNAQDGPRGSAGADVGTGVTGCEIGRQIGENEGEA